MATTPITGAQVFYDVAALGAMWEWRITSSLTWTSALRSDRWSLGRSGFLPPGYGLTNAAWDRSRTDSSFNVGVVGRASDADTWRIIIGRGTQLPSLMNLGGFLMPIEPIGFASGVPDLEPTVVTNYEVGWDRTLAALGAQLRLQAFHGRSRDVVGLGGGLRFTPRMLFTPVNVNTSETSGFEASIEGRFAERWQWSAAYLHQEVDGDLINTLPPERTLVAFERTTPRRVAKTGIGWSSGAWQVNGYLRYQSSAEGFVGDGSAVGVLVPVRSYAAVDARLSYDVSDRVTLTLNGHNLGRSAQAQTSAADVERSVFGTLNLQF